MVASDEDTDLEIRQRAREDARRYYLLALAFERRAIIAPALIVVGGIIASGKSTVASKLAVPVIDADRTRKHLAGVTAATPVKDPAWQGIYSKAFGEKTYAELLRRARAVLTSGRPVIVDASYRSRRFREAARGLAGELDVPFSFVECRADIGVCRERLRRRASGVSDARLGILDDFVSQWEPVAELSDSEHVVVETSQSIERTLEGLRHRLPVSFARLTR